MRPLLTMAATMLAASTLAAQPPAARGAIVGTVRDSAGTPVGGASVDVDGAERWTGVGADGAFRLADVAPGAHAVRARALGFAGAEVRVEVAAGAEARVALVLARAPRTLDTVRTLAAPTRRFGPSEFEERRKSGRGVFVTRGEFESRAPSRMTDVLLRIPGLERRPVSTDYGGTQYLLVFRGTSTVKGQVCPPEFYLDGHLFDVGRDDIDRLVRPGEIDALEVYRSGTVPPQFSGPTARCGVIVLWTRATGAGPG